jgi:N-acetylmuramoyl-L-alanine amidase
MSGALIPTVGLVMLATAFNQALRSESLKVSDIRFWSYEETTRIAVELSGEFEYHVERLHSPERVFFDIRNAKPALNGKKSILTVEDKLVKRIRIAETQPGVTRIVIDLGAQVDYTASQLVNPDRLMVELRKAATVAIPVVSEAPQNTPVSSAAGPSRPFTPPPITRPLRTDSTPASAAQSVPPPPTIAKPSGTPPPAIAPAPAPALPGPPAVAESRKPTRAPQATPPTPAETGQAARHTADGRSSLTRALGLKVTRVVIDPGHGGHDQGTVGPKGYTEKELVLDVSQRLGKLIEENMGSEVIFTRTDDTFVPLQGRTAFANERKADLFISVHANSSPVAAIRGVETYYLNFTTAKDALDTASRENASSEKSIFELRDLIQQITMHEKIDESKEFATRVQSAMQAFEHTYSPTAKNRGIKKAPFVVLIGANMPSILTEIGFLSNAREEALLKRPEHRQKLADALYRGVSRYAQSLSHFQVARNDK